MRKFFYVLTAALLLSVLNALSASASVIDELNYINEKTDFYSYINVNWILNFIGSRGIDVKEFDDLVTESSDTETDKVIKDFGIRMSDVNEFLLVMNTQDVEKKSGYLIFLSLKKGTGVIPESFKKNSRKLKSWTVYNASVEDDVVFTKIDDFFVIGSSDYLNNFLERRSLKKPAITPRSSGFAEKAAPKSMFFQLTVSEYLKKAMNEAVNSSAGMPRGLRDNVFIQTLMSLESFDWGFELNDRITFKSGLQGSKPEDSERLQMLCHTWIVGSSFVVSFADLMAARSGDETLNELTADQQLMSWMQKVFGRIHVNRVDKGVVMTFEMTASETDIMVSFVKKEMDKAKKEKAARLEREKITRFTAAVREGNSESVQKFIKEKYNINGLDSDGITPLGAAAIAGNIKIARLLIDNGASVKTPDVDKYIPLHHAVKNGNKEMVTFLLTSGSDVNAKGAADMTPLHLNGEQGNSEITRILLAKGALINAVDESKSTALHYAAASGSIEIVKVLVEKKADPELLNSEDQRAIDVASLNGHTNVVEYLKAAFKQEPKSYSEDDSSDEDYNSDDNDGTDDGSDNSLNEEDVE